MKDSASEMLTRATESLGDLLQVGTKLGMDLLDVLVSRGSGMMSQLTASTRCRSCGSPAGSRGCNCHIPPPCWAPLPLGEIRSHVCPGGTAVIRFCIENCGTATRQYRAEVAGAPAGVTVSPHTLTLGPMERGVVAVSATVAASAKTGESHEYLIWIRGCREHYLRWTVAASNRGTDCCHEIVVEDCPDLIHHWYDHFYCEHRCEH